MTKNHLLSIALGYSFLSFADFNPVPAELPGALRNCDSSLATFVYLAKNAPSDEKAFLKTALDKEFKKCVGNFTSQALYSHNKLFADKKRNEFHDHSKEAYISRNKAEATAYAFAAQQWDDVSAHFEKMTPKN